MLNFLIMLKRTYGEIDYDDNISLNN